LLLDVAEALIAAHRYPAAGTVAPPSQSCSSPKIAQHVHAGGLHTWRPQWCHKPTDTDFNASVARLRGADCDVIALGTAVRDTSIIIQTVRKAAWSVDLVSWIVAYDMAVAGLPGGAAEVT
jgi:hypothetical protein